MSYILKYNKWRELTEAALSIDKPTVAGVRFAEILKSNYQVKEQPRGSNKGPEVSAYLQTAGVSPGNPWCMAFVYSMFNDLSSALGTPNPLPKTAGVMYHWSKADPSLKITVDEARKNPGLVKPGQIFIMSRPGQGKGHTGIVVSVDIANKSFKAIEGNTNDQLSGEGDRVGINKRDLSANSLIGFIDYFKGKRDEKFENIISQTLTNQKTDFSAEEKDDTTATPVIPNSSISSSQNLLKIGATGEEVTKVQAKLGVTQSGNYDAATEQAVRKFQTENKDASGAPLKPDGIVGPRTREALFGATVSQAKPVVSDTGNVTVGTNAVISIPPGKTGPVPVFVFYPGIAVGGRIGRDYMPPLIKAAVPDWYSKYVIVIPNQHTTPWENVKAELDKAMVDAGLSQKNISIGVFSGSGNNSADISKKVKEIRPRNFIVMDPTPGANLTNSINSLGTNTKTIMMYNPSNWGNAGYYTGGIGNLEKSVGSVGALDKVSTGHMKIPTELLLKYKSEIERNV